MRLRSAASGDVGCAFLVLALTAAAAWLCFLDLHGRGLWWDEVATWHDALSGHRNPQEAPLNDWVNRVVMTVMRRNDDFALHVTGACCGLLTVPAAFLLGLGCGGRLTGILASMLVCASPTVLGFAQEARPYPLLILLTTLLLAFAVRLARNGSSRDLAAFAVLVAAAASTHLVALPFIAALCVVLGTKRCWEVVRAGPARRVALARLVAFVLVSGVAIAAGASWVLFRPAFAPVMTGRYTLGLVPFVRYVLDHCVAVVAAPAHPLDRRDLTLAAYVAAALVGIVALARSGRGWALACVVLAPMATLTGLYFQLGDKSTWVWFKYGTPSVVPFLALVATGLGLHARRNAIVATGIFVLVCQSDVRASMRAWAQGTTVKKGEAFVDAAKRIAADRRFVGTIFAPEKSVFGDESDRLIASYALARLDTLPSYFAPWRQPLVDVEWRTVLGPHQVPIRTERVARPLPPGRYAVFLGWDAYRGCAFLSPQLKDPSPPVTSGTFIPCIVTP
jgi:hypothetical protein